MRIRKSKEKEFWLINTSVKKDVSIADLRITIRKGARINLLSKHYSFTHEQLLESARSGSIFKKRHLLAVREVEPPPIKQNMVLEVSKPRVLVPLRNPETDIKSPYIEELDFEEDFLGQTDEQFAAEQAEAAMMDHAPALAVDKKFTKSSTAIEDATENTDTDKT